jgi:diadenosine tetraphosphate (Ap4A) HIT family hydrolase
MTGALGPEAEDVMTVSPQRVPADRAGCLACDLTTGRHELPGGLIHATTHWRVEHCIGPLGVGTLIVKPIRHVEQVADLTVDEAAELGPLLQKTAAVVRELNQAGQIYVCLWSHGPVHIHFVVQPETEGAIAAHGAYGPKLQVAMFNAAITPDPTKVAQVAETARGLFGAGA